jgi:uncharacterized protein (TIGR00369 family)
MSDHLRNSAGVMHGGVLATLADAAVGIGLASHFGGRRPITTTEMKINFLRPIQDGKIVARSHLLRIGKRLCVGRVDMRERAQCLRRSATPFKYSLSSRELLG